MKKNALLLIWMCFMFFSKAQVFQAAFTAGELVRVQALVDSQGNIILTGIEPSLSPQGDTMAYHIVKYSPQGVEQWRRKLSSPHNFFMSPALLNDKIYIVGSFQSRLHFSNTFSVAAGDYDFCYVKIDENGNMSVKTEGSTGREMLSGLCAYNNQLYAVGSTSGQVQMNNAPLSFTTPASFMEKLDISFNPLWVKRGFSNNVN